MSIFEYNGAAVVAMAGDKCVAIGSDLRLGVQFQTLATDYKKVYKIHDHLYLGLAGLGTDAQTLHQRFMFLHNMYKLREERNIRPTTFGHLVSSTLYEKRCFVAPTRRDPRSTGLPGLQGTVQASGGWGWGELLSHPTESAPVASSLPIYVLCPTTCRTERGHKLRGFHSPASPEGPGKLSIFGPMALPGAGLAPTSARR